jgi:nicotinamidase-related amidase
MPITRMDEKAGLVVIDLQKGMIGMPAAHPMSEIVSGAAELAKAFRAKGLPVVLVNVTGAAPGRTDTPRPAFSFPPDWAEFVPELDQQPSDHVVSKQRWGAFLGTNLDELLRGCGVTQIVLTGVATSIGVESTARSAYDLGYNVALVVDAMTDRDAAAHRRCLEKIFPRLGETDTTANVLRVLAEKLD